MEGDYRATAPHVPRNKYLLLAATVALAVALLQLAHLAELPFGSWLSGAGGSVLSTASLLDFMRKYGYISLFMLMALESASTPVPSEVVLPFAGYLVSVGVLDFWLALAVSTLASLTGALVDYFLALWLGRPFVLRLLKVFGLGTGSLDRAERWFERSGQWTVFVARFVPAVRTVISLPAGLFEMRLRPFIIFTVAGCLAWAAILIYAGSLAGAYWNTAFASSSTVIDALSGIVAVIAAAYIAYFVYGAKGSGRMKTRAQTSVS
ncbi:MAG: DedA family protein [Thaumarchaeota archaeon]|nr:DedA family protein [Nitrososphaerota archaeon]